MNDSTNEIYVKAFNHAYLLSEYKLNILNQIVNSKNKGAYFDGLRDGKETYEKEKILKRASELDRIKGQKSQSRDLER